jgi:hypothetical protein
MAGDATIYFAVAVAAFAPVLAASLWARGKVAPERRGPRWATPAFFFLWIAPGAALVYLFHCAQPGYVLLSVPPLALLLAWLARHALNCSAWTAAGVAVALAVSWFPFERFMDPARTTLPFVILRSTPRIALLTEASQREIRTLIDSIPGNSGEKVVSCLLRRFEAPNIRTVTYDFADVAWTEPGGVRPAGWLCNAVGLPPAVRAQYPGARRIGGYRLYSFWAASPPPL